MPNLIPNSNTLSMSSREIAELVGSRHDKVKQSIERLSTRRVIGSPPAVGYLDNLGRPASEYRISKRDSFIVAAQLSPASISGVVDAWGRSAQSLDEILSALDAFDVPGDLEGMFVYAIRNAVTGSVKLGISRDPVQRVKQLQTGNDCPLELIACRKADNGFADERAIHQENSQHHIRGEWFSSEAQEVLK